LIARKVCLLGGFAVGKTSLVRRFVESLFSVKYQTTVGVKVDKKVIDTVGKKVCLVLWDIHGVAEDQPLRRSYLRGAHGYLLVCDGTRRETLYECMDIAEGARAEVGDVPSLLLMNKADLRDQWEVRDDEIEAIKEKGWRVIETSALNGRNVDQAFTLLATSMVSK
jgi:small GTP-binding protein